MLYVLKLFPLNPSNPQWSSDYRGILGFLGRGIPFLVSVFFFFQIEKTYTFMNISNLKYHLSVILVIVDTTAAPVLYIVG